MHEEVDAVQRTQKIQEKLVEAISVSQYLILIVQKAGKERL